MIGRIFKAIGVAAAATLLGSLILALGTVVYGIFMGADTKVTIAFIVMSMPALLVPIFGCSLVEMLVILLPASLALRQFSREPALAYILIGTVAASLVALMPFASADRTSIMALLAPYGASTGFLYWFAFRRRRPAATPAATG